MQPHILFITILLLGFGESTAYLIPWSLLPDAIDADPDKSAGIYTAWMVFIQKIGIGLSVFLLGLLLFRLEAFLKSARSYV